ncbi:MAG: sialate O-acetylesterase [Planctomycetota bacterium]
MAVSSTAYIHFAARLFVVLAGVVVVVAVEAAPIPVDVVLMGGQSNSVGAGTRALRLPGPLQNPQDDVLYYHSIYRNSEGGYTQPSGLTTLRPGGSGPATGYGAEILFGHRVKEALPDLSLGIIKSGRGGTSVTNDWNISTGQTYQDFLSNVDAALGEMVAAGYAPTVTGMLWTQGESDGGRPTELYAADLEDMIDGLRSRYNEDLKFFISRLSRNQESTPERQRNFPTVRAAQEQVAEDDPLTFLIDTDDLGVYANDPLHFNDAGQQELGRRFAAAYVEVIPEPMTGLLFVVCGWLVLARRQRVVRSDQKP